jgi:hypothetical protein
MSGRTTHIPGYTTPKADLQRWGFVTTRPFGFAGANLHIENATLTGGNDTILRVRGDTPDFYGTMVMRDITVRANKGDVMAFVHTKNPRFDYVYDVLTPTRMVIEDIVLENPGRLNLHIGAGFDPDSYGPVAVRNSGPIGRVATSSRSLDFSGCHFADAEFQVRPGAQVNLRNCVFTGKNVGLKQEDLGVASGNVRTPDAQMEFPPEYLNPNRYDR